MLNKDLISNDASAPSHPIPREARYVHYSSEFVSELLYSSAQNRCLWASLWGCNNLCTLLVLWASAEQTLRSLKLSEESPRCEMLDQKQSDVEDGHPEPEQSILLGNSIQLGNLTAQEVSTFFKSRCGFASQLHLRDMQPSPARLWFFPS